MPQIWVEKKTHVFKLGQTVLKIPLILSIY